MNTVNGQFSTYLLTDVWSVIPHAVLFWSDDQRCIASNQPSVLNFTGILSDFILNQHVQDLPLPAELHNQIQLAFVAAASGRQAEIINEISDRGKRISLKTTVSRVRIDDNRMGFVTLSLPIHSMNLTEQLWRTHFEKSEECYALLDETCSVLELNHSLGEQSPNRIIGTNLLDQLAPSERLVFHQAFQRTLTRSMFMRFEVTIEKRAYSLNLQPFKHADERPLVLVRFEDVTERKMQRATEEAQLALLNDVLANAREALLLMHSSGRIVFANQTANHMLKGTPVDAQDLHILLYQRVFNASSALPIPANELELFKLLEAGVSGKERFVLKTEHAFITVESTIQVLAKGSSGGKYLLWTLRDITSDARRLENLIEVNARMDSFVRAAAHDLRAPVNNILNLSKLLKRSPNHDAALTLATRMEESSAFLHQLLEGLMQLAETRSKEDLNADNVNLEKVIKSILKVLHFDLARIHATVDLNLEATEINYNTAYVHSICYNLISNAIKYHAPERPLTIAIRTVEATNGLWLIVEDNGRGMDLQSQKQDLFKPFTRLTNEGEGKGIGLSLVKSFVESNGGEIHVESSPGVGSTFKLLLRNYTLSPQQYELFE